MAGVGVRSSWSEAPPALFPESPASPEEPPPTFTAQEHAQARRPSRLLKARRPGVRAEEAAPAADPAAAPTGATTASASASPSAQPADGAAPFVFGTPGAGPSNSTKARRSRGRTPIDAAAASPAFTASSSTTMAWSPFPSSSAEAATAFGATVTPGSATPTSGPAPPDAQAAAQPADRADVVAADLQCRLNLGQDSAAGARPGSEGTSAPASAAKPFAGPSFKDRLGSMLHAARPPHAGTPPAAPHAAPAPAAVPSTAEPPPAGFSFVFGAAVPGPTSGAAARRKMGGASPAAARPHPRSNASSASTSCAQSAASSASVSPQRAAAARPEPANWSAFPAAGVEQQGAAAAGSAAPPAGSFVFGASSGGSPAAQRARHRTRSPSRSPGEGWAAAAGGTAPEGVPAAAPPAGPEPLREQQPQQPPAGQHQQSQAWFVRLGGLGKPPAASPASPGFSAAPGSAARRPPRRKSASQPRSGGKPARPPGVLHEQEQRAPPTMPPLSPMPASPMAVSPAPAAAAGAAPDAGLDARCQAAYSSCEMYRSQGNEAFRDGDYTGAYELYTKALHALWPHPPLHQRLALLLSNRAAALLSLGKPLSALADCQMGLKYDPALMRCALRVATCHSRMGDFDEAFQFVAKLRAEAAGNQEHLREIASKQKDLEEQERQLYDALRLLGHSLQAPKRDAATGVPLERTASGGSLHRAGSTSGAAAAPGTSEAFWEALKKVDDVAPHVPHSELLMAAKAEGLLRVGKHSKAREFCEQPVHLEEGESHRERARRVPWRLWVRAQCSWHEGDAAGGLKQQLQDLRAALERDEQLAAAAGGGGTSGTAPCSAQGAAGGAGGRSAFFPAGATAAAPPLSRQELRRREEIRLLVGLPSSRDVTGLVAGLEAADRLRLAGNEAVKAGKAADAVKKYTEALAATGLSPAIAAVLLSNRAAAYQHLKQRAQAVADCCRAVALNPHYAKAHSRLATLLAELGYHGDAATALEAAIAAPGVSAKDKSDYQQRLAMEQAAAKRRTAGIFGSKAPPVDHYKMLGVERSAATEDVRRAYKKLALQLHPDKAASVCRVAVRCCGCGTPTFEAQAAQARLSERATWLFKLLGEASEVLSDAAKRRELDHSLNAFAAGSASGLRTGGFSSWYGDEDSDDESPDVFFGAFGRRGAGGFGGGTYGRTYGAGAGYGTGYGTYGSNRYGTGGSTRYWGF